METKQKKDLAAPSSSIEGQRAYTARLAAEGFDYSLMVAGAFVRGIRDIGYKSTATALDELFDNAIQAGASNVHVAFGFASSSSRKPTALAVIDDGHGMDAAMLRASVLWGGTHREGDRTGFGRYGYGMPSSCVSQGRRFSVYSWHAESDGIHSVTLDVDDIGEGKYTDKKSGQIIVPSATKSALPDWIENYIKASFPKGLPKHGTVVMIEKLDRLTWSTTLKLQEKLLEHLGVYYRNYLRQVSLAVNGRDVEVVDPLFLTPGARFHGNENERAKGMEETHFEVKDATTSAPLGVVRVRYAYLPYEHFAQNVKAEDGSMRKNPRYSIMKEHNGIIVLRQGRQLDVVNSKCPWTTFQNNDRFLKIEVDFPATMDEFFSVTTSKQQVMLTEAMWSKLEEAGVYQAIREMRKQFKKDKARIEAHLEDKPDQPRVSEQAMAEAAKFKTRKPGGNTAERERVAKEAFKRAVDQRSKAAGLPFETVEREMEIEMVRRPFRVEDEASPGAPFYRVERRGGQLLLVLNTGHRFYTDVYAGPESTPRLRAALEVLLFVMGECELDATDERRLFYEVERSEWTRGLNVALDRLGKIDVTDDRQPDDDMELEISHESGAVT